MATTDKYDRQLRLWGSNGQRALMKSNILLINANAVGTETLKNLVLPGVGQFTILDNELVTENDLGNNFFIDESSLGQPRATAAVQLLQELNPDVKGNAHIAAISSILLTEPNYLQQFNLIVAANLIETNLVLLAAVCNAFNIPLVVVRSYGMIGYCRIQLSNHEIVESRPEGDTIDLSLVHPFPELAEFCNKFAFLQTPNPHSEVDTLLHSHIPYVAILYHATILWRQQCVDGSTASFPKTAQQKEQFKSIIVAMSLDYNNEMNFQEAVKESHRAWFDSSVSSGNLSEDDSYKVVANQKDKVLTAQSSFFSCLVRALAHYLQSTPHGSYPVVGSLPDMTATTEYFTELQRIYHNKAIADKTKFTDCLRLTLGQEIGYSSQEVQNIITQKQDEIDTFCRNARHIRQVSTRTLADERAAISAEKFEEAMADVYEDDPAQTPVYFYIALRAADAFYSQNQRYPGAITSVTASPLRSLANHHYSHTQHQSVTTTAMMSVNPSCSASPLLGANSDSPPSVLSANGVDIAKDASDVWLEMNNIVRRVSPKHVFSVGAEDVTVVMNIPAEGDGGEGGNSTISIKHAEEITRYGGDELHNISAIIGGIGSQEIVKILTCQYICINHTIMYNGICGVSSVYEL